MEVATMRVTSHHDCPIYIRRFGTEFETLALVRNELRSNWLRVKPRWYLWVLWKVGYLAEPYTGEEKGKILNTCVSAMRRAIENVLIT